MKIKEWMKGDRVFPASIELGRRTAERGPRRLVKVRA